LLGGYLLAVNGSGLGWTVCAGPLGENVVSRPTSDARMNAIVDIETD
jgi:hypothetical protein